MSRSGIRQREDKMRKRVPPFLLAIVALLALNSLAWSAELTLNNAPTQVYFSPHGGCTEAIIAKIDNARSEILIQAYSFTSAPIAKALVQAHKRGVKVEAILDKSQRTEKYTSATFLANSGIPTFIDARHAIAHNKVMIIDGETVITGSFNFTKAAEEKNAENLLIIKSRELASIYIDNWKRHKEHSEVYKARY
jgi:phosphatidylserine/phosphatidylglycerophosphate/cardiolipin synthase-like enzyme